MKETAKREKFSVRKGNNFQVATEDDDDDEC